MKEISESARGDRHAEIPDQNAEKNAGAVNQKLICIEGFSGFGENAPVYAEPE